MYRQSVIFDFVVSALLLEECTDNDLIRVVLTQRIRKCHVNYLITSVKLLIIPMCKTKFIMLQVFTVVKMSAILWWLCNSPVWRRGGGGGEH